VIINILKKLLTLLIDYKIILVTSKGLIIETTNKYIFNDKSTIKLKGKIFSSNFNGINNKVNAYESEINNLLVIKQTQKYENIFGYV
jgi:hypothetical protein